MTKVAITGPASGTGTYTLNAPDTNDTLDFELPITGTHLASAQSDGMPLGPGGDPVVESGSNTDGEWTRWADGTQVCAILSAISSALVAGKEYAANTSWTFPLPFINNPTHIGHSPNGNVAFSYEEIATGRVREYTPTGCSVQSIRVDATSFPSANALNSSLHAVGRWK